MPSRKSFGGAQLVNVPMNLPIGEVFNLGRSGKVRRATQEQLSAFRKKQAKTQTARQTSKALREQASKAGKALGDPGLSKRVSVRQQGETVRTGKTGSLQRFQPDPEVFVGDTKVSESRKVLRGKPFIAGDVGTEIILSEVQRRGAKGRRALSETQRLAKRAGLKGFKAKQNTFERMLSSKTLGIPNVLLAIATAGMGNLASAGQPAGTTTGAGQAEFVGIEAGTGAPGFSSVPSNLQFGSTAATTAGGGGFIGPATRTPAVSGGGLSVFENIRRGFNVAKQVSSLLGGGAAVGGAAKAGTTPQPQFIFRQPQVVQQRQTTTAGALPAFVRRNRDRFSGTRTSSLFTTRDDRRSTLLGGR